MTSRIQQFLVLLALGSAGCGQESSELTKEREALRRIGVTVRPVVTQSGEVSGQNLVVVGLRATDDDLRAIAAVQGITELDLLGCELPSDVFAAFSKNDRLRRIYLGNSIIPIEGYRDLARHQGIVSLRIDGMSFDDDRMEALSDGLHVEKLHISNTSLTDAGIAFMRKVNGIRKFTLHSEVVSSVGLRKASRAFQEATVLELYSNALDDDIGVVLEQCPMLEVVGFSGSERITDKLLPYVEKLQKLRFFSLGGTAVTKAAIEELKKRKPDLIVLY
jgi:hypothetical protein